VHGEADSMTSSRPSAALTVSSTARNIWEPAPRRRSVATTAIISNSHTRSVNSFGTK
jgi:hypothetical protein